MRLGYATAMNVPAEMVMESALRDFSEPILSEVFHDDSTDKEPSQGSTAEPRTLAHLKALLERLREKRRQKPQG